MNLIAGSIKEKLSVFKRLVPYGTFESWDDLDPKLYHAVHIFWLRFYGLWYYDFSPKRLTFWLRLMYTLTVLWLVCFLPGIGEVEYLLRQGGNVGNIAEGLYLFLSEMYTYFKIAVFWLNKEKILTLLKYLHCAQFRPEEEEHREILRRSIKTARFVMTYYSSMCVGAVSVGIIMPLTENFEILPTNVEYTSFDVYKAPAYGIVYLHHIYYKPATCIIDGVMDTILAAFISSAIGQIEILAFNLRNFKMLAARRRERDLREHNIVAQDKDYYVHVVLKKCVIHYNAIIRSGGPP